MTVDEFKQALFSRAVSGDLRVIIGQGVELNDLMTMQHLSLSYQKLGFSVSIEEAGKVHDQVDHSHQCSVHKHNRQNVLISKPARVTDTLYTAWLSIQDENELLQDHMTGQHIQGMVLTESARQMMLSVTENFYLAEEERGNRYFVLNRVNSEYINFTFPLDVRIDFVIHSLNKNKRGVIKAKSKAILYQGATHLAEIDIDYSVYDKAFISDRESELASDVVASFFAKLDAVSKAA
ncbi:hypothetical protein EA26_12155 [Vibrio navarrensis]|uniref:A-factor biosynthesis hotdog domain-containing protein n=2 Tax=Vibrio navarrensis TaxID=29495 RepID=A0A099LWH5_9VIBR|nr:hypothetical protein EA26_12155 [Vibrio navarrensis]KGK17951.1 hypothetical protein EA25_10570 [Vibrio navarrensis]MBE4581671.1 hypothetical protein [Vibrio navarrensis]